jgi:tetratricopeptide (TPR) repeat protein
MEGGTPAKGAKYLERVVQKYPSSRKFEDAVIYLGDFYFDKSKFKAAQAKFSILVHRKDSPMHYYALYKNAWCDLNQMRGGVALREMKQLVKDLEGEKDPAKFNLREQALRDLVTFYADAGDIDDAMDFFNDTVGKDKALSNLRILADTMRSKARDKEAIAAYQRLMREQPDSAEAPFIQLGIYQSLQQMDKTAAAVEALSYALDHYGPKSDWASDYKGDKADLANVEKTLEAEGSKAAFFFHASGQKGSNRVLYGYALALYDSMLRSFPEHPDRKKFQFFKAEVLYSQKKWLEAADSYVEASKIAPKDKMTDEAVYNALLALDQLTAKVDKIERFTEEQQKNFDLTPREIPEGERKFIDIAQYYMKEYPKGDRIVDVQFRIAAIHYRYRHFDEALPLFEKIVAEHPKHRSAVTCASIVLDVLNMQKNYDKLDATARRYSQVPGLGDKKFQSDMKTISQQIGFKQVEKLEGSSKWKEAGETYLALYKGDPTGSLAEKSLYNALVSFEKSGDTSRTQDVTRQFITKYPKSQYTESLVLSMAKNAEKLYDFEESQKLYNDFYRNHPKSKEARKALYNSAVFAELLEHNGAAVERYNDYLKSGNVSAEERKAIDVSLAKLYRKSGNWQAFSRSYHQLMKQAPKNEDKIAILGDLAYQYELAGRASDKAETVREIKNLFAAHKNSKNIGIAAKYIAEAEYQSVASQRRKYDETVLRFPVSDLIYLVGMKQRKLKNLAQSYDHVIEIGVPEWGVAALHDKADAFAAYGVGFRKLEIPKKMVGDERKETELGMKKIEADVVVALDKQADEMFKLCVAKATEFHVTTDFAGRCRTRAKSDAVTDPSGQMPKPSIAAERFKQWEGTAPSPDDSAYVEYLASLVGSRGDGAEKKLKDYLAKQPTDRRAAYLLGSHYQKMKKDELALYFFSQLEKDPAFEWKAALYNQFGLAAMADHNKTLATEYFEKATKAEPAIAAPFANLGAIYLQSHSYPEAEKAFRRAEAIDSDSEEAVMGLGAALEGQGKFDAAHEIYAEFLSDNSKALAVLYNDSILLGNRLGQKDKAAQQMMRYIQAGGQESAKAQETLRNWR